MEVESKSSIQVWQWCAASYLSEKQCRAVHCRAEQRRRAEQSSFQKLQYRAISSIRAAKDQISKVVNDSSSFKLILIHSLRAHHNMLLLKSSDCPLWRKAAAKSSPGDASPGPKVEPLQRSNHQHLAFIFISKVGPDTTRYLIQLCPVLNNHFQFFHFSLGNFPGIVPKFVICVCHLFCDMCYFEHFFRMVQLNPFLSKGDCNEVDLYFLQSLWQFSVTTHQQQASATQSMHCHLSHSLAAIFLLFVPTNLQHVPKLTSFFLQVSLSLPLCLVQQRT